MLVDLSFFDNIMGTLTYRTLNSANHLSYVEPWTHCSPLKSKYLLKDFLVPVSGCVMAKVFKHTEPHRTINISSSSWNDCVNPAISAMRFLASLPLRRLPLRDRPLVLERNAPGVGARNVGRNGSVIRGCRTGGCLLHPHDDKTKEWWVITRTSQGGWYRGKGLVEGLVAEHFSLDNPMTNLENHNKSFMD